MQIDVYLTLFYLWLHFGTAMTDLNPKYGST